MCGTLHVSSRCILRVSQLCPAVQHLDLAHSTVLDDGLLADLATALWLETLDISHCPRLTAGMLIPGAVMFGWHLFAP